MTEGASLDDRVAELATVRSFAPPADFQARAHVADDTLFEKADQDRLAFWAEQARTLDWETPFSTVLNDADAPFYRWFEDGTLNASHNCLDRHVAAGLGDRVAYYWRGEEGEERTVSYADLLDSVQRFANALRDLGVGKGDVVGIYLPMVPEVAVAMLACARIGAVHNVVFGGFSAAAVRERMAVSQAKVLVTADHARRKGRLSPVKSALDPALEQLEDLAHVVVVGTGGDAAEPCPMTPGRDVHFDDVMATAAPTCPAEPMEAEHPLFILYSSGSTGKPKGIVHSTGGYLTGVSYTHHLVFDLDTERDVYWCTADVGWITGHSYAVYGPLANAATSVMFEGAADYPHPGIWWEVVERYGVSILYTAPTAIRACMRWGSEYPARHDLSSLRLLGTVGEPINPKAWLWYHTVIGRERCPIVDTWWQTETGAIMIAPLPGLTETKPGSATHPVPGVCADLVDGSGTTVAEGTGLLVLTEPCPSMLRTLYGEEERYVRAYFSEFGPHRYAVGDSARRDTDGYYWVLGRVDDVLNVSGHRLSTGEVESAIVAHERVAESAVVSEPDEVTGEAIVAFVTLRGGAQGDSATEVEIREHVSARIGKLARPSRIIWAEELPKTRSGKIMRRLLRDAVQDRELGDVTTLNDPSVMTALRDRIAGGGSEDE